MGPFLKAAAITGAVAVPVAVAYNVSALRDDTGWKPLGALVADIYGGGAMGLGSLAVAGVCELVPALRPAAKPIAGAGVALLGAGALGLGTVVVGLHVRDGSRAPLA
jgi:hypothetical protein